MPRVIALVAVLLLVGPAATPARAQAEPIMPLAEVRPGLVCWGATVVRGVDIATFGVEVLDVVAGDPGAERPRILIRVSGPPVDGTGIGPGFSGSPIRCADAAGVPRNIGAISEGIGEYGGKVVLATPIELVLGTAVDVPAAARRAPRTLRAARPLASPISVSGVSGPMAALLRRAARRAGRPLAVSPAGAPRSRSVFPVQPLVPGASVSVGLASGAVSVGAIGTVAYAAGDAVWAFGHPFDGAGRRSLLLQDAWVHTVVSNPLGSDDLTTYKLASPGHDVGTLTNDGNNAVAGRVGALPARFPLRIVTTDVDRSRTRVQEITVADESGIGLPTGVSGLGIAAPTAIGNGALAALDGGPARQSGRMCMRVELRGRERPLRFCNRYVGGGPGPNGAAITDVSTAIALLDSFELGVLDIERVEVNLRLSRAYPQTYLRRISAPRRARRGSTIPVRLSLRRSRGAAISRTVRVRIPRDTPRGVRELRLAGTGPDSPVGAEEALIDILDVGGLFGEEGADAGDAAGPATVGELAEEIAAIRRDDRMRVSFSDPDDPVVDPDTGEALDPGRPVARIGDLRIGGRATRRIRITG